MVFVLVIFVLTPTELCYSMPVFHFAFAAVEVNGMFEVPDKLQFILIKNAAGNSSFYLLEFHHLKIINVLCFLKYYYYSMALQSLEDLGLLHDHLPVVSSVCFMKTCL